MTSFIVAGMIGGWELIVIALMILLIFGGKKIPELMKGLGQGIGEFKKGMKEGDQVAQDDKKEGKS